MKNVNKTCPEGQEKDLLLNFCDHKCDNVYARDKGYNTF